MQTVDIHHAKTQLSRLIEKAAGGDAFIIAKAGKPMVKVIPVESVQSDQKRLGFLAGKFSIPDDFDRLGDGEIEALFGARK